MSYTVRILRAKLKIKRVSWVLGFSPLSEIDVWTQALFNNPGLLINTLCLLCLEASLQVAMGDQDSQEPPLSCSMSPRVTWLLFKSCPLHVCHPSAHLSSAWGGWVGSGSQESSWQYEIPEVCSVHLAGYHTVLWTLHGGSPMWCVWHWFTSCSGTERVKQSSA